MAGEWIAVDIALDQKPEVQELIDTTGRPVESVCFLLWKLWGWASMHCGDGTARMARYEREARVRYSDSRRRELFEIVLHCLGIAHALVLIGESGHAFANAAGDAVQHQRGGLGQRWVAFDLFSYGGFNDLLQRTAFDVQLLDLRGQLGGARFVVGGE